jgi:hypothetical protein
MSSKSCSQCGYDGKRFFVESLPCRCGELVVIEYYTCDNCQQMWRVCNDVVVNEPDVIMSQDLEDLEVLDDIITKLITDPEFMQNSLPSETTSMEGMLVRCIQCNEVANEIGDGVYVCTNKKCMFMWETL